MSRTSRSLLALIVALVFADVHAARPAKGPVKTVGYDWDETTMFMRTLVYLVSKHGGPGRTITTGEYAHEKAQIGKSGKHEQYTFDNTPFTGSFRDTSDADPTRFARDVEATITGEGWQGPKWQDFVRSLSTRQGARRVSIITAREHAAQSIYAGLKILQRQGYIRYLPLRKRLYGVGRPGFSIDGKVIEGGGAKRKLEVQRALLDELAADHARTGRAQAWTFSDDDWFNYTTIVDGLRKDVADGRWPGVTIEIRFVGGTHAVHPPEVTLL
jgi:hypothetical protein